MFVMFKNIYEVIETNKALGVPIIHDEKKMTMWIPKSLIDNKKGWKKQKMIDVPDWFYDKKIDELFF